MDQDAIAWQTLEALLARLEQKGARSLAYDELEHLGALYRRAAARLADARERRWDQRKIAYLEALVRRAHFVLYPPARRGLGPLFELLASGFPRLFRQTSARQTTATLLFFLGAAAAYLATSLEPHSAYALLGVMLPPDLVQGLIESEEVRKEYLGAGQGADVGWLSLFAASLAANNLRVSFAAFALGIAGGLPTAFLVLFNGAVLGSFAALFNRYGFNSAFWAWLLPHGVPEILGVIVAAAAGLHLGAAVLDPKGRPRRQALALAGKEGGILVGFAIFLILYAAVIEGYFRQTTWGLGARYGLAAFNAALLFLYLRWGGRARWAP